MTEAWLAPFEQACADPLAAVRAAQGKGQPVVGWIGLDAPLEILDAAGALAVRITGDLAHPAEPAGVYGEGGGHPGLRAIVSRLMEPAYAGLDSVVVTAAPVTGIGLYQFLVSLDRGPGRATPEPVMFDLNHAVGEASWRFNVQALETLQARYPALTPGALADAIKIRNHGRQLLNRVEGFRRGANGVLTGSAALTIHEAEAGLSPAVYNAMLTDLVAALLDGAVAGGTPVVVSGTAARAADFYAAFEQRGFRVVADDHDYGSRAIGPLVDEGANPVEALAERYVERYPAPAQWSTASRVDYLLDLVRGSGARAVIFDIAAFDHPAAWDYPAQRDALRAAGLGEVLLPMDAWRDPAAAAGLAADSLAALAQV